MSYVCSPLFRILYQIPNLLYIEDTLPHSPPDIIADAFGRLLDYLARPARRWRALDERARSNSGCTLFTGSDIWMTEGRFLRNGKRWSNFEPMGFDELRTDHNSNLYNKNRDTWKLRLYLLHITCLIGTFFLGNGFGHRTRKFDSSDGTGRRWLYQ